MRGTYDATPNAAYVYLVDEIQAGEAVTQVPLQGEGAPGEYILDLDAQGRVIGIEILGARGALRADTLEALNSRDAP